MRAAAAGSSATASGGGGAAGAGGGGGGGAWTAGAGPHAPKAQHARATNARAASAERGPWTRVSGAGRRASGPVSEATARSPRVRLVRGARQLERAAAHVLLDVRGRDVPVL